MIPVTVIAENGYIVGVFVDSDFNDTHDTTCEFECDFIFVMKFFRL